MEYPVTKKEIIDCLKRQSEEASNRIMENMICGDMTPTILDATIEIISSLDFEAWDLFAKKFTQAHQTMK